MDGEAKIKFRSYKMIISQKYSIGNEVIVTHFYSYKNEAPTALILHGAGNSNKSRTKAVCENLLKANISSLTLDFSGHGESSRNSPGSIQKRINEASFIIESMETKNISLFAFSMSGQVAISLAEKHPSRIKNLILFCPAIYCPEAINTPFGETFSQCIRTKESWKRSLCKESLSQFTGNLILIIPEHDEIIPEDVSKMILNGAAFAHKKRKIIIKNAPHAIGKWMNEHPKDAEKIIQNILVSL